MPNKKIGRNDPCPCGSGKKYKKCCLPKNEVLLQGAVFSDVNAEFADCTLDGILIRTFKCPTEHALELLPAFFAEHKHEGFDLAINDMAHDSELLLPGVNIIRMPAIIEFLCNREHASCLLSVGVHLDERRYLACLMGCVHDVAAGYELRGNSLVALDFAKAD